MPRIISSLYGELLYVVRYWDFASTKGKQSDYTAGCKMGMFQDTTAVILDMRHGKYTPAERDRLVRATAEQDGFDVIQLMEEEGGSSGKDVVAHYRRLLVGYAFRARKSTGSKETRAIPFATACEANMIKVLRAGWNDGLLDELESFPNGSHDDRVDACAGAYNELAKMAQNTFSKEDILASGQDGEYPGGNVPEEELEEYPDFLKGLIVDAQQARNEFNDGW